VISKRQLPELRSFVRAELNVPLRSAPVYGALVVPNGNGDQPVHRWFKYKEAFSADLLGQVLDDLVVRGSQPSHIRLLDPFCGMGTGLLSAQLLKRSYTVEALGIDCNPLSAFVARTKLSWPQVDPEKLRAMASDILSQSDDELNDLPVLSSIRTGRCISHYRSRQILTLRAKLESCEQSAERDVLLLGLASCIEPVSKVRRDGRALRIVAKARVSLKKLLADRWELMARDVEALKASHPSPAGTSIWCGDGRKPALAGVADSTIDLIVTSPPYPNNIDYNEVYKLELWLLGFATSPENFLALRRQTYRSHPTCSPATSEVDYEKDFSAILENGPLENLLGIVARRVKTLDSGRAKVLLGYLYDTWVTLQAHHRVLRSGGRAIYVVGNSLHGSMTARPYLIPTDLIFSTLGRMLGYEVDDVLVARSLSRRLSGNHFLRDSLVVLRKP
jgi:hypothetical protein